MNTTNGIASHVRILAVAAIVAMAVAACTSEAPSTTTSPTTPAPATTTPNAPPTASGPMSGDELVWLEGVARLHKAMDAVPSTVTPEVMRSLADQLGSCTRELDRLGPYTDRLQPVYTIAKQGCVEYEQGGQCFATAVSLGAVFVGSAEEQKYKEATDCGFASFGKGSTLFADAEAKGFEVKDAAR